METKKIERPEIVADEHLIYLDEIRESGETNMFHAGAYLREEFALDQKEAWMVLAYWMDSFSERHPPK